MTTRTATQLKGMMRFGSTAVVLLATLGAASAFQSGGSIRKESSALALGRYGNYDYDYDYGYNGRGTRPDNFLGNDDDRAGSYRYSRYNNYPSDGYYYPEDRNYAGGRQRYYNDRYDEPQDYFSRRGRGSYYGRRAGTASNRMYENDEHLNNFMGSFDTDVTSDRDNRGSYGYGSYGYGGGRNRGSNYYLPQQGRYNRYEDSYQGRGGDRYYNSPSRSYYRSGYDRYANGGSMGYYASDRELAKSGTGYYPSTGLRAGTHSMRERVNYLGTR
eukprot:CAMPEP_0197442684 /NCGR_PEP_ID=MMETSP1175-20131217/8646_1 /TAXON_ID=1003142 /ORGANISM="Triceratium dubium, Strain CCMP147" /LENGTH=271 /DNA_ID=CAMNT_0042973211 /DNA_START=30 /DNA_END=845 /DNA_ORIENTATION=+